LAQRRHDVPRSLHQDTRARGRAFRSVADGHSEDLYTFGQAKAALNVAQRFFALLTLCQETTAPLTITAGTNYFHLLNTFSDFLLPLRIRVAGTGGAKIPPGRIEDFTSFNPAWPVAVGVPTQYACLGFDFLIFNSIPAANVTVNITYAQAPPPLVNDADVPVIPEQFHPCLMDFAVPLLRSQEGGQEFSKCLPLLGRFLQEADKLAQYVRARNLAHRYDRMPFELQHFDRSSLLNLGGMHPWPTSNLSPPNPPPA
jgi:hypothetical protein